VFKKAGGYPETSNDDVGRELARAAFVYEREQARSLPLSLVQFSDRL